MMPLVSITLLMTHCKSNANLIWKGSIQALCVLQVCCVWGSVLLQYLMAMIFNGTVTENCGAEMPGQTMVSEQLIGILLWITTGTTGEVYRLGVLLLFYRPALTAWPCLVWKIMPLALCNSATHLYNLVDIHRKSHTASTLHRVKKMPLATLRHYV